MKNSKKKQIKKMEWEDDQGILRKKKTNVMSIKTYKILKLISIALIPISYFIYSPLLLPVCIAYFALFFVAKSIERGTNKSLKKEYYISIAKFDSVFAFVAIIIAVVGLVLSLSTTSMKGGMFEGKSDEEISAEMEERGMDEDKIEEMIERMGERNIGNSMLAKQVKNVCSMLTGERVFFTSYGNTGMGGGGGGKRPTMNLGIQDGSTISALPEGGTMDFAKDIPFSMIFSNIASSVNTVVIFLIPLSGLLCVYMLKKL
jgi:hypothetical protein